MRACGRWDCGKIRQSVVREDNAQTRGLIKAVHHLVEVEAVEDEMSRSSCTT